MNIRKIILLLLSFQHSVRAGIWKRMRSQNLKRRHLLKATCSALLPALLDMKQSKKIGNDF